MLKINNGAVFHQLRYLQSVDLILLRYILYAGQLAL